MSDAEKSEPQRTRANVLLASPHSGAPASIRRAWTLLRSEGVRGLCHGSLRFGRELLAALYQDDLLYLYELPIDRAGPLPWEPPVAQCKCRIIEDNAGADALVMEGYEDFRIAIPSARKRLERGAVAAIAYVNRAFASIDWMLFSEDAQRSVGGSPCPVRYSDNHACTADALTSPQFRNMGIATYRLSEQLRYMRDRGIIVNCSAIRVDNVASQRCVEKHGAQVRRVCRYRRILGWKKWTERSPEEIQHPAHPA